MKLQIKIVGVAVAVKQNENKKDPSKPYYNVVIESNDEADTFSCTQEVFNQVKKYHDYSFVAVYDTNYKYLRIETALELNKGK